MPRRASPTVAQERQFVGGAAGPARVVLSTRAGLDHPLGPRGTAKIG
jgi:hypothetical protein